jgi:hypothetical protein
MTVKLQDLKLSEEHKTWLKEVYSNYNNHLEVEERRELIVKLVKKLSKNFSPSLIDKRIYHYYNGMSDNKFDYITLFGIWLINPDDEVFKNIEKIIISVKNLIEENSKITEVTTKDIVDRIKSDGGSLDESEVKKALFSMKDLYSFFTINSYKMSDNEPYSVIQFNNEFSLQPFLYFSDINTLMEESFEKQSIPWQNIGLNQLNIISPQGNDEIIEETNKIVPDPDTAFVMMPLKPTDGPTSIHDIYNAIRRSFKKYGIEARHSKAIIDEKSSVNIINEIMREINKSEFLIADITSLNINVIFEVGYSMGARRRLILICHNSKINEIKDRFFDLSGYNIMLYEDASNLEDRLIPLLENITGKNPKA